MLLTNDQKLKQHTFMLHLHLQEYIHSKIYWNTTTSRNELYWVTGS